MGKGFCETHDPSQCCDKFPGNGGSPDVACGWLRRSPKDIHVLRGVRRLRPQATAARTAFATNCAALGASIFRRKQRVATFS